jgi:hypothetical protein
MQAWMDWTKSLHRGFSNRARVVRSFALCAAVVGMGWGSSAFAGFSTINGPAGNESSQPNVLDHVYGGTFSLEPDGVDYTNGTISAVRVDDYLPIQGNADNPGVNGTDQLWTASSVTAQVEAAFAGVPSSPFGYIPGTAAGSSFVPLFNISGTGFAVSGSGGFTPGSGDFQFAAENQFGILSSSPSSNKDGQDHVVTYEIDGLGDSFKTWLLFFDDYGINGDYSDFDYQDLVIQLKTVPASSPSNVPEPGSLMVVGGVVLGLLKRLPRRVR